MSQLDTDGCLRLLAAIARQWWRDARHNQQLLCELADWMDVSVAELATSRSPRFRAKRSNYDNFDEIPINPWPRHNFSATYSHRGTGS